MNHPLTGTHAQPVPSDSSVREAIHSHLSARAALGPGWLFVETAGGVHSPGPSGTSQADLYAPLRTPVLLVGDSKLGGISQTIAAYESLKMRGQDIEAVLLFRDDHYGNYRYLEDYFRRGGRGGSRGIPVETLPAPPAPPAVSAPSSGAARGREEDDARAMMRYYESASSEPALHSLLQTLDRRNEERISRLESMSEEATRVIWWPFTQQKNLKASDVTTIDSASGDFFQALTHSGPRSEPTQHQQGRKDQQNESNESSESNKNNENRGPLLRPAFDGSASWWTQGLGHGNPQLTLAAAYAAGRYGHAMFAGAVHEPALALAEGLLAGMGNPRLQRCFYTDNGSTGCEVAVKMGLRASRERYYGHGDHGKAKGELGILGLKGSYHGDTQGAMDLSEPSVFNEKVEWYRGDRGVWLDYPALRCTRGSWFVDVPPALADDVGGLEEAEAGLPSLDDALDLDTRMATPSFERYKQHLRRLLEHKVAVEGRRFGALVLEPMVLGAGGMVLV